MIFDNRSGNLLYIIDGTDAQQLVVAVNYVRRGSRDKAVANVVISAYRQKKDALMEAVRAGALVVVRGDLN